MPLFSFEGKSPRVHPTAFIAPTANLIGDVTVEERLRLVQDLCPTCSVAYEHPPTGPALLV